MGKKINLYLEKSRKLLEERKTGYECLYCGNTESERNTYGIFCKGCGAVKPVVLGVIFGVPVTDAKDAYDIAQELEQEGMVFYNAGR